VAGRLRNPKPAYVDYSSDFDDEDNDDFDYKGPPASKPAAKVRVKRTAAPKATGKNKKGDSNGVKYRGVTRKCALPLRPMDLHDAPHGSS
jgi:hypothetical protein